MTQFLPSRYVEVTHHLALGIEPIDALRGKRLSYELQIQDEKAVAFGKSRAPIERHTSNLFALRYQKGVPGSSGLRDLRFFDSSTSVYKPEYDRRRIVPRRLSIPILEREGPAGVEAKEVQDLAGPGKKKNFNRRIRRPVFFPGAAYDFSPTSTALRGRVLRNGEPMRWARVTATLEGTTLIAGRAHGDDRGEFLLLINPKLTPNSAVPSPLKIKVSISGPVPALPVPNPPPLDPLWDLPVETLSAPDATDLVATGEQLPNDYDPLVEPVLTFTLGKCLFEEFEI